METKNKMYKFAAVYLLIQISCLSAISQVSSVWNPGNLKPVFKVFPIHGVNGNTHDFSPVVVQNQLVFITDREADLVNLGEDNYGGIPRLSILYSKISQRNDSMLYSMPKLFPGRFSEFVHTGPITFLADGNIAVFTGVKYYKDNNDKTFRPQLFSSVKTKNSWSKPMLLPFSNHAFSYGHPSLSSDGNSLFFVSNKEGGYGGNDIYVCRKSGDNYSDPVNLGPEINNPGNQVFPCLGPDGLLYFASDGHRGLGGLDLFFAVPENEKWIRITNLGSTINTGADDFAICFSEKNAGYFSSNRIGGKGDDDIYRFNVNWITPPVAAQLYLLNSTGDTLMAAVKNEEGYFSFRQLPFDKNYSFIYSGDSTITDQELQLMLTDLSGKIMFTTAIRDSSHLFRYEYLPEDKIKLYLLNPAGDTLFVSTRTRDQFFAFNKLPFSEKHIFMLDKNIQDPNLEVKLVIYDEKGQKLFTTASQSVSNKFRYEFLPEEKIRLYMLNDKGDTVAISTKDRSGYFIFKELPFEAGFITRLDANDTLSAEIRMMEFDETGKTKIIVLDRGKDGSFHFVRLPYSETLLYLLNPEGDTLMIGFPDSVGNFVFSKLPPMGNFIYSISGTPTDSLIQANVIFKSGDIQVTARVNTGKRETMKHEKLPYSEAKLVLLNAAGDTLMVASRDETGNFIFDKLPQYPIYFFAFSNVDPSLITDATVLFKKKEGGVIPVILHKDETSGEYTYRQLPYSVSTMYLISLTGDTLMSATMNEKGNFVFEKLPPDQHYLFSYQGEDPELMRNASILFKKSKTEEVLITVRKGKDGFFRNEKLPFTEVKLSRLNAAEDTLIVMSHDVSSTGSGSQTTTTAAATANSDVRRINGTEYNTGGVCLFFKYSSAIVHEDYFVELKALAQKIKADPDARIKISGYTDGIGTHSENMILSKKRAYNVARKLIQFGAPVNRLRAYYYGYKKPAADNRNADGSDNPEGREKNRRVEVVVL